MAQTSFAFVANKTSEKTHFYFTPLRQNFVMLRAKAVVQDTLLCFTL